MVLASFRLLGPIEVGLEDRLVDIGHARQRSVLAVLLIQANRVVPLDRLIECLWGDDPPATSTDLVYGYVSRLRRQVGEAARLEHVSGGYRLDADPESIDLRSGLGWPRSTASSPDEAHALAGLGRCALATGHIAAARDLLRQSQEIFQRIGAAEAHAVLAELDALTSSG